ncbi:ABC transporter permease [Agrococcus sediminis]|uniref:ABC transporter permease n=1 Tax=Agrococcus TaxID=46352 RepID=UPI000FE35EB6|nr:MULTISPECIES: ABC transporter permease [unclassified Agrococcus]MDR7234794.1 peptide/nickel transport system permease protein [Agrococcus sp. BE272]RWR19713.1 ABC transporter permease [Agrococcus lahaulensis]UOW00349.1 ABC transporter permease [Agrococcus sp. SCSIO52902]
MSAVTSLLLPRRDEPAARPKPRATLVVSIAVLAIALAWAFLPWLFTSQDPLAGVAADALQAPSAAHPFGNDATGRDLLARVIFGAGNSLSGAAIAVLVGLLAGTAIGVLAGSIGGLVEEGLMRVVDVLLAIPGLLLALSVIVLLGFGVTNAAIAVGVTSIAVFARLSRSQVVRVRRSDYVEAAFGSGGTFLAVLGRHVLPNSLGAVLALAALQFGSAILQISTLGFLGYGAPPPTPEWGLLIAESRDYVASAWWLTTLPGVVVAAVVLAANRIAAAIREATA